MKTWEKRKKGGLEVDEDAAGVLVGPVAPHPLRLHPQAQFVDEPGGDRVRDRHAQGDPAGELHLDGRPAQQDPGLHRLLQPGLCQTVQLDLHRPPSQGLIFTWATGANRVRVTSRASPFTTPGSSAVPTQESAPWPRAGFPTSTKPSMRSSRA